MTRCQSCDGILTKKDEVCYYCGEEAPGHEKGGLSLPMVLAVGLILSAGVIVYSFFSGVTPY